MQNGVTIGIPVYNEEARIERTIRSVVDQCEMLIVSDNASTDRTGKICEKLALEFKSIRYIRQPENIGSNKNWMHILHKVNTPYFMFLGAHDYVESNYIPTLLTLLKEDEASVGAFGRLHFDDGDSITEQKSFNRLRAWESDSTKTRILGAIYSGAPVQWAIYGLYKSAVFKRLFFDVIGQGAGYGADVLFIIKILQEGKFRVASTTNFYAWIRKNDSAEAVAKRCDPSGSTRPRKQIKNDYFAAQHKIMLESLEIDDALRGLVIKLRSYAQFGPFKCGNYDALYYLAFIPAKIVYKVLKLYRRLWRRLQ